MEPAPQLPLVLASTSRYRARLLERLGVPFEQASPGVDERALDPRWGELSPAEYALELARAKAAAVARELPGRWILAADQLGVLTIDGAPERLDQPGDSARNVEQLVRLAGRTHELVTGVVLQKGTRGERREHVDHQRLTMRAFEREEAEAYVARCAPVDCAGGYRIEDAGIALFEGIEGGDPTGIEGLPLIAVARMLRAVGLLG